VVAVDDLLVSGIPDIRRKRLMGLREKTPIVFEVESPLVAYPVWGEDGKSEHLTIEEITGRRLKEKWGIEGLKSDMTYNLYDYWDLEYRVCVYLVRQRRQWWQYRTIAGRQAWIE